MTDMEQALNDAFVKVFGAKFQAERLNPRPKAKKGKVRAAYADKALHRNLAINSAAWREQVAMKLVHGYGAEDIAIWLNCHVSHVQAEVKRLRASGMLAKWWGRE